MGEQRRFWQDCADAQARLNLRCSHRRYQIRMTRPIFFATAKNKNRRTNQYDHEIKNQRLPLLTILKGPFQLLFIIIPVESMLVLHLKYFLCVSITFISSQVRVSGYGGVSKLCCSERSTESVSVKGFPCIGVRNLATERVKHFYVNNQGGRAATVKVATFTGKFSILTVRPVKTQISLGIIPV